MEKSIEERRREVATWLDENVVAPPRPIQVSIADIEFDWERGSGSFMLSLDSRPLEDRFSLTIGINGKVDFGCPMFISPLGVPASYAAVRLDEDTRHAIERALERTFPEYFAYGRHKGRRRYVDAYTPLMRRIKDQEQYQQRRAAIDSAGFVISEVVTPKPLTA
jgi:hypothetical protein